MTDVQTNQTDLPEGVDQSQAIASLKKQADTLGISYKSNVSIATLQKAIKEKLEPTPTETASTDSLGESKTAQAEADPTEVAIKEAMKLVRVIITPMEATKASHLERELFCAGNSLVGTVKRVVEFGEPWHVEQILLNAISEKKYQLFTSKKNTLGAVETKAKLVPAYNIAYLPALTEEELTELADQQARTRSLEDD